MQKKKIYQKQLKLKKRQEAKMGKKKASDQTRFQTRPKRKRASLRPVQPVQTRQKTERRKKQKMINRYLIFLPKIRHKSLLQPIIQPPQNILTPLQFPQQ